MLREQVPSQEGAPLLPKLRGNFAEFLDQSFLKRLGILSPPTCVGLRYGLRNISFRGFSRQHGISHFSLATRRHLSALKLRGFAYEASLQA